MSVARRLGHEYQPHRDMYTATSRTSASEQAQAARACARACRDGKLTAAELRDVLDTLGLTEG